MWTIGVAVCDGFICKLSGPAQTRLLPRLEATEMQGGAEYTSPAYANLPGDIVSASDECKRDQRFTLLVVLEIKMRRCRSTSIKRYSRFGLLCEQEL